MYGKEKNPSTNSIFLAYISKKEMRREKEGRKDKAGAKAKVLFFLLSLSLSLSPFSIVTQNVYFPTYLFSF